MELAATKYKQTELGLIPSDWEVKEFVEVMDGFSSGQTPYRAVPEFYKGEIPWITSGELNYNVITDTVEKITIEGAREANLKMIPKGSFLFAITGLEAAGTRGSCAITGIEATTNQSCMALYPKRGLLITPYLYHYYVRYGNELAFKYCQGTKQQSYTGGIAKKLPIIVPSTIEEQAAIATALSDADALISSLEKLIAKKRNIKQGAMQKLLQPKEGWEVRKLGEILKNIQLGGNYPNSDVVTNYPLIKMGNIQRGYISINKVEYIISDYIPENKDKLNHGDVLFNTRNTLDLVGKVSIWQNQLAKAYFNSNLMRLEFNPEIISSNFFMNLLFNTRSVISKLKDIATGTTSVAAIYTRDLLKIEMPIPPKEEQVRIATILSDMDAEIAALETKLEKYRKVKLGMMQNLLTGKIRLI